MIKKFSNIIIFLKIIGYTIFRASIVFWLNARNKLTREAADYTIKSWCKKMLDYAKVTLVINNPYHVNINDGQRYVLMSNHISHYDIPTILTAFAGSVRMVAKKELSRVPMFGPAAKDCEIIFIDRTNKDRAIRDLNNAKQVMYSGINIWIAPEGTRSRSGELGVFKKGGFNLAIESEAWIVPIAIKGTEKVVAADSFIINKNQTVTVEIGKPINASSYKGNRLRELLKTTRESIQSLLDK